MKVTVPADFVGGINSKPNNNVNDNYFVPVPVYTPISISKAKISIFQGIIIYKVVLLH